MGIGSWRVCLAVTAVALGAGTTSASAATINFDVPIDGTVSNSCTGETVAIQGTAHFKATDNSSLSGIKSQLEMNLTGVRGTALLTGARYVMNSQSSDMQHAEFDPFGNAQVTFEQTEVLTRLGDSGALLTGDDFRLHLLSHLTVVKGVPKADKFELRADCR